MKTLKEVYGFYARPYAKKISRPALRKMIIKEVELISEDAEAQFLDPKRFPKKLSNVDPITANLLVRTEPSEEDEIGVFDMSIPVQRLKPSQSSMNIYKALAQAISMIAGDMELGGNLEAFVSNDMHIMDGHHRWIATAMVDPNKPVGGYQVDFPAEELIRVLNTITVGLYGKAPTSGKKATGGFEQFKEKSVRTALKKIAVEGIPGDYPRSPESVLSALEKFTDQKGEKAIEAAAEKFINNLKQLKFDLPSSPNARPDMPIIDNPDLAIDALEDGKIDINPPYNIELEQEEKNEVKINLHDNLILERWQKLAGFCLD